MTSTDRRTRFYWRVFQVEAVFSLPFVLDALIRHFF